MAEIAESDLDDRPCGVCGIPMYLHSPSACGWSNAQVPQASKYYSDWYQANKNRPIIYY